MKCKILILFILGLIPLNLTGSGSGILLLDSFNAEITGRGGVSTGWINSINTCSANPASAGFIGPFEMEITYFKYILDMNLTSLSIGTKLDFIGISAGFKMLNSGEFTLFDIKGNKADNISARDYLLNISAGMNLASLFSLSEILNNLYAGLSIKYLYSSLYLNTGRAIVFDTGIFYNIKIPSIVEKGKTTEPNLGAGMVLKNIGTSPEYVNEKSSLPQMIKTGIKYTGINYFPVLVSLGFDFLFIKDRDTEIRTGFEIQIYRILILRAGYAISKDILPQIYSGIGIIYRESGIDFNINYALTSISDFGLTHNFSITIKM